MVDTRDYGRSEPLSFMRRSSVKTTPSEGAVLLMRKEGGV